ncbi:MarR family winged helix-turn-helix transcriptional regulator [Granulicatella sp.]
MKTNNPLSQRLCYSIYSTQKLVNKYYQHALAPYHLTYTQFIVLQTLWEDEKLSLGEIGQRVGLESNTLTPLLKRLEEKKLIIRKRPVADKRQLNIRLSANGKRLHNKLEEHLKNCFANVEGFDFEQAKELVTLNNQLKQAIENYIANKEEESRQVEK